MPSITKQRIGKYTYLYESVSYRDDLGRPRNYKTKIGKIDPDTGVTIYSADYLTRNPAVNTKPDPTTSLPTRDIPAKIKEYAEQFFDSINRNSRLFTYHKMI